MNRRELVESVRGKYPELLPSEAKRVVDTILGEITRAMCEGNRFELRGFGVFSARHRRAKVGRNPKTGESVYVPQKSVPFFKASKSISERLNSGD